MTESLAYLRKRINELKTGLNYDDYEEENIERFQELVRAFIVLSHAELEQYFEDVADKRLAKSLQDFIDNGNIDKFLLALASSNVYSFKIYDKFADSKVDDIKLEKRIQKYYGEYRNRVIHNNGIKEKYLVNLFIPLGLDDTDMDTEMLQYIEDLANKRGNIAHTGGIGVTSLLNYKEYVDKVYKILELLITFDAIFD